MLPSEKIRYEVQGMLLGEVERTRLLFLQNPTDRQATIEFEAALDRLKDFALYGKLPEATCSGGIMQTAEIAVAAAGATAGFR